jgi:integrase
VATIVVVMFGGMCRYDDASCLMWRNIRLEADGRAFEITFDKRKNSQYRQGNKVLVTPLTNVAVCPARVLQRLRVYIGGVEGLYVFRGFNGRLVSKSPGSTAPGPTKITYDQVLRYLSLWFSGVMGVSVEAFRKQFATQSGRSGGASAAAISDVPKEV